MGLPELWMVPFCGCPESGVPSGDAWETASPIKGFIGGEDCRHRCVCPTVIVPAPTVIRKYCNLHGYEEFDHDDKSEPPRYYRRREDHQTRTLGGWSYTYTTPEPDNPPPGWEPCTSTCSSLGGGTARYNTYRQYSVSGDFTEGVLIDQRDQFHDPRAGSCSNYDCTGSLGWFPGSGGGSDPSAALSPTEYRFSHQWGAWELRLADSRTINSTYDDDTRAILSIEATEADAIAATDGTELSGGFVVPFAAYELRTSAIFNWFRCPEWHMQAAGLVEGVTYEVRAILRDSPLIDYYGGERDWTYSFTGWHRFKATAVDAVDGYTIAGGSLEPVRGWITEVRGAQIRIVPLEEL